MKEEAKDDHNDEHDNGIGASRRRVLLWALASRLLLLALMVLSDALLPDHNPGPGVIMIDNHSHNHSHNNCYCLKGYACDTIQRDYDGTCADDDHLYFNDDTHDSTFQDSNILSRFYSILLSPLTKWDAARFIYIAAYPRQRLPLTTRTCSNHVDTDVCTNLHLWEASEQAHAFLPLCTQLFALLALWLNNNIPRQYLPSTFVGTSTLAALLINTLAFLLATLALHDVTYTKTHDSSSLLCAERTAFFFVLNPANVFFTAAYSESIFAALLFLGHAYAAREHWYSATALWMAASYTRSNGSWMAVWLLLQALASLLVSSSSWSSGDHDDDNDGVGGVVVRHDSTQQTKITTTWWKHRSNSIGMAILHTGMAILVVFPMIYHDQQGKMLHCNNTTTTATSSTIGGMPLIQPDWCDTTMSLYGHVQRKHWNVGWFRYYEWKQLPNFLLAAPILVYGIAGVISWIHNSWSHRVQDVSSQPTTTTSSVVVMIRNIFQWAVIALAKSSPIHHHHDNKSPQPPLLLAPSMLADYAMLAMTCFLGLTVAHVQISTRLICSSCPAIYWYMAHLDISQESSVTTTRGTVWRMKRRLPAVRTYCVTYIGLGILLHVNWLPWT